MKETKIFGLFFGLLLFCFTFFTSLSFGQEYKLQWGPETESQKKLEPNRFIGKDDGFVYFLKDTYNPFCPFCSSDQYLEKYDVKSLLFQFSKQIARADEASGKVKNTEGIVELNQKLFLFSSLFDKNAKQKSFFVNQIGQDGFLSKEEKSFLPLSSEESNQSWLIFSSDSSKIALITNSTSKKESKSYISFLVLDSTFKILYSIQNKQLPIGSSATIHDYALNSRGDLFLLSEIENEKANWFKDRPSFLYKIILFETGSDAPSEFDIQLDGKTISDMGFRLGKNQDLIVAGFYSNKGRYSDEIAGTFYLKLDAHSQEVVAKGLNEFDKSFLMNFMSARNANRGEELREFKIDQIVDRADGGAYMVAEQRYRQTVSTYNGRYTTTDYYYNFNDIIVASIDPEGKINWVKTIPKTQVTINDRGPFSGYAMAVSGSTIHFVFNDNAKNLRIPNPRDYRTFTGPKNAASMLVSFRENGQEKRQTLFLQADKTVYARPKMYWTTKAGEMFIYCERGRKAKVLRLSF